MARPTRKRVVMEGRQVGPRSGYVKATFSVEPDQLLALQEESFQRAKGRRPDMGEIVREVLAAWMKKREK